MTAACRSAPVRITSRIAWLLVAASAAPTVLRADPPKQASSQPAAAADDASLRSYFAANGLLNRGLFDSAAQEYRAFLSQHADHPKAQTAAYGLAVCLFRSGKLKEADEQLAPLAKLRGFPYAAEVGVMRGQCAMEADRFDDAARAFAVVCRDQPDHELADDAAGGAVEALFRAGKPDEALERCDQALSLWPQSPQRARMTYFAALSAANRNDFKNAVERLQRLLKEDADGPFASGASLLLAQCQQRLGAREGAAAGFERVIDQGDASTVPDALLGLASLRLEQGKPDEAGRLLDDFEKRFPDHPRLPAAKLARGRAYVEQKNYAAAAKLLRDLSRGDGPGADEAAWWLAKCRLREERFADAAAILAEAIERHAKSGLLPEMYYDRGAALYRAGDDDAAARVLGEFRERFADHALAADALQLIAAVEHRRKHYDESGAACAAFLEAYPKHELAESVRFLAAENDFLAGRLEKAVDGYRRFLAERSDGPQALTAQYRMGTALFRLGRLEEAEPLLAKSAASKEPGGAFDASLLGLGDLHFQRGEWKQAEQCFARFVERDGDRPGAADALLKLGIARQRQDRHAEAVQTFEQLIGRGGNEPAAVQATFERGQSLAALQRGDEAVEAFNAVLNSKDGGRFAPFALNHLAAMALAKGDAASAVGYYDRLLKSDAPPELRTSAAYERARALFAAKQYEPAAAAFAAFVKEHPDDARAAPADAQRAVALSRLDRGEAALQAIAAVEKTGLDRLPEDLRTAVQYEKAWRLRGADKSDAAAAEYRRVAESAGDASLRLHALTELAELESAAKHWDETADACGRIRALCKQEPAAATPEIESQAAYLLGVSEFERRHFEPAAAAMEELVERFPDDKLAGSACYYAGESLFRAGQFERAARRLSRASEQTGDDAVRAASLLRLGECLAQLQQWARSERAFADYLDRFAAGAEWFQAQFGVGWARENQKRFDEAISAYRGVTERHKGPTAARAQFQIGECLFAQKKFDDAVRELLKVDILYAYPEWSAAAVFEAGRCLEQIEKHDQAREQFRLVADKYGETRWGAMARQQLEQAPTGALPGRRPPAGTNGSPGRARPVGDENKQRPRMARGEDNP